MNNNDSNPYIKLSFTPFIAISFINANFLSELSNLKHLIIIGPSRFLWGSDEQGVEFDIGQLKGLTKLESLKLNVHVKTLDALSEMAKLTRLSLESGLLQTLSGLQQLDQLKGLCLASCLKLNDISHIVDLNSIEYLDFKGCRELNSLKPLENTAVLEYVNIERTSVKSLDGLNQSVKLRVIDMQNTPIADLDPLSNCISLEFMNAEDCKHLNSIKALKTATDLKLFVFTSSIAVIVENWFKPKFIGDRIQIDSSFVLLTII